MARKGNPFDAAADRTSAPRDVAPAPRVRTEPIRVTLDLSPRQHRALKRWCAQAAVDLDLPQVPLVAVLRSLGELLTDGDPEYRGVQEPVIEAVKRALLRQATDAEEARTRRH